jgi:hypothetical protein
MDSADIVLLVALPGLISRDAAAQWTSRNRSGRGLHRTALLLNRKPPVSSRSSAQRLGLSHHAELPEDPEDARCDAGGMAWALSFESFARPALVAVARRLLPGLLEGGTARAA